MRKDGLFAVRDSVGGKKKKRFKACFLGLFFVAVVF